MAYTNVEERRAATSWGAVLGGWIATLGASVLFAPAVAGLIAAAGGGRQASDVTLAVPVVLGILLSYLVGGYVAGRMAGYRTSWHGLMTAFFSLFVLLVVLLLGAMADAGIFAGSGIRSLADLIPGVRELNASTLGDALTFGAILGFLAAIFGGWLGGLLAPPPPFVATRTRTVPARGPLATSEPIRDERRRDVVRQGEMLPTAARKGGERMRTAQRRDDDLRDTDDTHTERVERE